jgi:hypothetical protein
MLDAGNYDRISGFMLDAGNLCSMPRIYARCWVVMLDAEDLCSDAGNL